MEKVRFRAGLNGYVLVERYTRYSMTEERPVSRVEMDTYIWHPEVHMRLGERMYFFYLNNLTLDSWQRLQKKLNEKEIFSFSIHRVNSETDFILRGWFSDQGISHVRAILTDFGEGVVKDSESKGFMAVGVLPTPPPNTLWAKKEYSDLKEWLKISVESWTGQDQYSRLRKLGIVVGKIEGSDTHIRVFLRIEVTKAGRSGSAKLNSGISGNSGHHAGLMTVWQAGVTDEISEETGGCEKAAAQVNRRDQSESRVSRAARGQDDGRAVRAVRGSREPDWRMEEATRFASH